MDEIIVSEADSSDIDQLFYLAEQFWHESNFNNGKLTLKPDAWKKTVREHMGLPDTSVITVKCEGKIAGYVMLYYQTDFTAERIGEMFQFYVDPEFRGTNVPRVLVEATIKKYEGWGCARAYAEASPGINSRDHLSKFKNLWAKFGYEQIGITLQKEF